MDSRSSDTDPLADAVALLAIGAKLSEGMVARAVEVMMTGTASPHQVASFLLGLRDRGGETAIELVGATRALRAVMTPVLLPDADLLVDTCGTGGGIATINISTAAAFVAAGAGARVAKHGNRSHTSRSGSADVLEALGIGLEQPVERVPSIFADAGLVFLFAPAYHPAMRHVAPIRRELGVATLFNRVGPLANPAGARRQVIGVAQPDHGPVMADALKQLGTTHALVVHAHVGMDEISPVGKTDVWEVDHSGVKAWTLDPAPLGVAAPSLDGLAGGDPADNARRIATMFADPTSAAPALRAAVIVNAAAAIYVAGLSSTWADAVDRATAALTDGRALARLEALRRASPVKTSG